MKKIISVFCILTFSMIATVPVFSQTAGFEIGDELFKQAKFRDAVASYEKVIEQKPDDYDTLWRLSHAYAQWGLQEEDKTDKKEYFTQAVSYAREAIEVDDTRFEGHLRLAEALGMLSEFEGPQTKVRFCKEIKTEAERAIEINPVHYKAYMILGVWNRKVKQAGWLERNLAAIFLGGIPEGSLVDAENYLKKSIKLKSDFPKSHFELALVYKALKKKDLAVGELKQAILSPALTKNDKEIKEEARVMLEK